MGGMEPLGRMTMATMGEIQQAAKVVRSAVEAIRDSHQHHDLSDWGNPLAKEARAVTAALGMSWDFGTWPHAMRALESAEVGERIFGVLVEA